MRTVCASLDALTCCGSSLQIPHTSACWMQAIDALRANAEGWWAVSLSPLITQAREFHILHRLKTFPVPSPNPLSSNYVPITDSRCYADVLLEHGFPEACKQLEDPLAYVIQASL